MRLQLCAAVAAIVLLSTPAAADDAKCRQLLDAEFSTLADAPTHLVTATFVATTEKLPAYCDVRGYVAPQVGIRLRIPDTWNGKFAFEGCGTMCGVRTIEAANDPLSRGYAVAVSDLGHSAPHSDDDYADDPELVARISRSGEWAYNNVEAELDLAFRGTHKAVLASKAITEAYTGAAPKKSYWRGCSTGGRQGLMIAQRYPWEFDGIIAGAPAGVQPAYINIIWRTLANMSKDGRALIGNEQLPAINKAVVAQCDKLDGLEDGVIDDPWACKPDIAKIPGLSKDQADALQRIYTGAHLKNGLRVTPGLAPGAEANLNQYLRDKAGVPTTFEPMAQDRLRYVWFDYDPGPSYTAHAFDLDRDYPRLFTKGALQAPNNPDLTDFKRRGGKLIVYQGLNDLLDAEPITDYLEKVTRIVGGKAEADKFLRYYLIPGMNHCRGGVGVDTVDWVTALEEWIEKGAAPEMVVGAKRKNGSGPPGAKGFPLDPASIEKTRPLYPFPNVARYKSGPADSAASFGPGPLSLKVMTP